MSAMQFKHCLDKDQAFICVVKPTDSLSSCPLPAKYHPPAQPLLEKYSSVLPSDLPKTLPPSRTVDHKIEGIPGSTPPSKPTYPLSLAEMDELKKQLDDLLLHGFSAPASHRMVLPSCLFVKRKVIFACA